MFCEGKMLPGLRHISKVLCLEVRFKFDSFINNYFIKHFNKQINKQITRQTRQLASFRYKPTLWLASFFVKLSSLLITS